MFQPKLGISLKVLTHNLTDEWVETIAESRIDTLDIHYRGPFNYDCVPPGDTPGKTLKNLAENFD